MAVSAFARCSPAALVLRLPQLVRPFAEKLRSALFPKFPDAKSRYRSSVTHAIPAEFGRFSWDQICFHSRSWVSASLAAVSWFVRRAPSYVLPFAVLGSHRPRGCSLVFFRGQLPATSPTAIDRRCHRQQLLLDSILLLTHCICFHCPMDLGSMRGARFRRQLRGRVWGIWRRNSRLLLM